jgi:succinate dehydrogenase flavin-adding protein (antitoxin of CptAB toxin-antitoxin module)
MNSDDLIIELGIEHLTPEEQQRVLDELNMLVGEAMLGHLSEEQVSEYEAIINGEQEVITRWLTENDPNYADSVAYQQLAEGYDDDPDKVPADKVYASMAWIEKNNPNLGETVSMIKATLKANLDQNK